MAKNAPIKPLPGEDAMPMEPRADVVGRSDKRYSLEVDGRVYEVTLEELIHLAETAVAASNGEALLEDVPELLEFAREYPGVTDFPPEVTEQIKNGSTPLAAYRAYENSGLRKRLRAYEQNEQNQKTALPGARGQAAGDVELDELMAIYKSVFK